MSCGWSSSKMRKCCFSSPVTMRVSGSITVTGTSTTSTLLTKGLVCVLSPGSDPCGRGLTSGLGRGSTCTSWFCAQHGSTAIANNAAITAEIARPLQCMTGSPDAPFCASLRNYSTRLLLGRCGDLLLALSSFPNHARPTVFLQPPAALALVVRRDCVCAKRRRIGGQGHGGHARYDSRARRRQEDHEHRSRERD